MKRGAAFLLALLLLAGGCSGSALAAPTCQDKAGNTMRCGAPGAMPVGWTAPDWARHFPAADRGEIMKAIAGIMLVLALIALMPEFKGDRWDRQEDDEEE